MAIYILIYYKLLASCGGFTWSVLCCLIVKPARGAWVFQVQAQGSLPSGVMGIHAGLYLSGPHHPSS